MILCHARAMAHSEIYRVSNPTVRYPRLAEVPAADADAEDWEPAQDWPLEAEDLTNGYDCGCDPPVEQAVEVPPLEE